MALKDFFTLSEMKDGLTAPARVKELINVLEKDKHNTVKNVGDSTRQWSAVASTIASTENKDCLAIFLQLDGLCYFDTWLKHGQKCLQETGDNFIEESIVVLLGAIEKLHREVQNSVISGIMMTVKDLLGNNSSRIQNSARALFDSWKQNNESNMVQKNVDEPKAVCNNVVDVNGNPVSKHEQPECSSQDISTLRVTSSEEQNLRGINSDEKTFEPATDEIKPAIFPETMQTEVVVDLTIRPSDKTSDHASRNDASSDPVHSCTSKLLSENSFVLENPSEHQLEATTGIRSFGSVVTEARMLEGQLDVANSNKHDEAGTFCADSANTMESKVGADNEKDVDVEKGGPCLKTNSCGDVRKEVSEGIEEMYDSVFPNPCSKISTSDSTAPVDVLQGSSLNELNMKKNECVTSNLSWIEGTEAIEESNGQNVSNEVEVVWENVDLTANSSRKEDSEAIEAIEISCGQDVSDKDEVSWGNVDLTTYLSRKKDADAIEEPNDQCVFDEDEVVRGNDPDFSISAANWKYSVEKKSDFQLDYDMFDPLEVARQVAIEVDCREPSCSSSERMYGGEIRRPESPDSTKGKNRRVIHRPGKDVSIGPNISVVVGDKVFNKANNLPSERENLIVDIEPTGVSEVAQNIEPDKDKHGCGFDLNKDVLSDDYIMDNQINPFTTPISLVSALRAPSTSGLPSSPLQFDRTHGWNGSAETSAFNPVPTRKVSERQNFIFASGSSSTLFQRQKYLDFDLNVAESEDDKISDPPPNKETPNSMVRPSGECALESRSKRSDLLQLDLNYVSDSGDAPLSYWRKEERILAHCNSQFSPSASSSSSSMQPSLKNIDLNDQPSPFTDFLHPAALTARSSPNLSTSGSGGFKTNESVISLTGVRVEVSQKDNFPLTIPLLNGRIVDAALDASMTRDDSVLGLASSSLPYAHPYMYRCNGPPSGSIVPYSSAIYGHGGRIPYMVDSRGNHVVPQVLGPVPTLSPSLQQPSFFESLVAAPTTGSYDKPSGHGFDLNSGLMIEGRNRDAGNIMQLVNLGQRISVEDQMRANSLSHSSSSVGGKRKETDGGLDPYPFFYKHHQPSWK